MRNQRSVHEEDECLMVRYADGDARAFEELFRRYERRAYAYFLKRTGSCERAEDLYQELFMRVHRARARYDPDRPFAPWLFQIARRLLVDDHRRAYHGHEVPIGDDEPGEARSGIDERLAEREELGRLLDLLSPVERHVVLSAKLEGAGYLELSAQLGRSVDAVKKLASRAIGRMRRAADEAAFEVSRS